MTRASAGFAAVVCACFATTHAQSPAACAPLAASTTGRLVRVAGVQELEDAVHAARRGDTIALADGTYGLRRMLDISVPAVTLRGGSGNRGKTVIRGGGMVDDTVGVGISVSAPDVTLADLTVRDFRYHAVQVRGEQGASRFTLRNAHLMDTGQQLLKGSLSDMPVYADEGTVACSEFSYTESAPSDYTNGVDVLGGRGWTIRRNRFVRIRGPRERGWRAGPAVLMWAASEDTLVENNVVIDSFRGIALGLASGGASVTRGGQREYDHKGGLIRNNVIVNLNGWADEAIEANAAQDVRIEYNTILVEGATPWSIGVRFPSASATIRNNLTNRQVLLRDGGRAVLSGNVTAAVRTWFVDPPAGDMRIAPAGRARIRAGVSVPDAAPDFDGRPRPVGAGGDVGAFVFVENP